MKYPCGDAVFVFSDVVVRFGHEICLIVTYVSYGSGIKGRAAVSSLNADVAVAVSQCVSSRF